VTILAALMWLHATSGFYGDRGSWATFDYPSLAACESDRPRQTMRAPGGGEGGMTSADLARIIQATAFRIINRHLMPRLRQPMNDNEPVKVA
jgi:hypothetical protein